MPNGGGRTVAGVYNCLIRQGQQFRLDASDPRVVACDAVMLSEGPQCTTRLKHVAAEVLHEAVVVLLLEEVVQRAARNVVPAHGVEELDDG